MSEFWDEIDEWYNDNRHCPEEWCTNESLIGTEWEGDRVGNGCQSCGSLNVQWREWFDCIDGDHQGTEHECFDCKTHYIN